jgi:hypothetical protein
MPVPQLAYLSSLLILGTGAFVLYDNYDSQNGLRDNTAVLERSSLGSSVSRLAVDVELDDCDLVVSGEPSELLTCKYRDQRSGPSMSYEEIADTAHVTIREGAASRFGFFHEKVGDPDWYLAIYQGLPIGLSLDCRDSDVRLRLEDLKVETLDARIPYSVIDLKLGTLSPDVAVKMRANRAVVRLRLPESAGVSFSGIDSTDLRRITGVELARSDSSYATDGYAFAPVRYALEVIGTPKSFTIDRY